MTADGPTDEPRSQHRGWWIAAGLLALLLITGLVILWIRAPDLYRAKDGAAQAGAAQATATTRGGILTVAAALIAATAAGAGLYFTAHTLKETQKENREAGERARRALEETQKANRQTDRRDRYAKASEQLGHANAPVRLGAMYSLVRLAQDNLELRPAVVDVLCAYLRMPFKPPKRYEPATESRSEDPGNPSPSDAPDQESERSAAEELLVRQTAQRLLADYLRPPQGRSGQAAQDIQESPEEIFWPGISLDLTGATLVDLNLTRISVVHAAFTKARFCGDAQFDGATFCDGAQFDGATFYGNAHFDDAKFFGSADFGGVVFEGEALFKDAVFDNGASFIKARFCGEAKFGESSFSSSSPLGASFSGAKFSDGQRHDFHRVRFFTLADFDSAQFFGDAGFNLATFHDQARFKGAQFYGDTSFDEVTFASFAFFGAATFSGDASFDKVDILHIDDFDLSKDGRRVWPDGWRVEYQEDDRTRGTLVPKGRRNPSTASAS
ncbi:pentapeptide repeat-containing protein [Geodermatophilus sp. URMC 60]